MTIKGYMSSNFSIVENMVVYVWNCYTLKSKGYFLLSKLTLWVTIHVIPSHELRKYHGLYFSQHGKFKVHTPNTHKPSVDKAKRKGHEANGAERYDKEYKMSGFTTPQY